MRPRGSIQKSFLVLSTAIFIFSCTKNALSEKNITLFHENIIKPRFIVDSEFISDYALSLIEIYSVVGNIVFIKKGSELANFILLYKKNAIINGKINNEYIYLLNISDNGSLEEAPKFGNDKCGLHVFEKLAILVLNESELTSPDQGRLCLTMGISAMFGVDPAGLSRQDLPSIITQTLQFLTKEN